VGEGPSCSCLTTKELQQNLRDVKQGQKTIKLLFEIPSSRIIGHVLSKYVVYQIIVIRTGSYDPKHGFVERRYSDFVHLHQQLVEEFSEELEDITVPRKLLTGNFNTDSISDRRLALQDYLAKLYAVRCVRYSHRFQAFFTEQEQMHAHGLLRAGQFRASQVQLQTVLDIQEKLAPWQSPALLVPTLCALAVCHYDLEEPGEAFTIARRALLPVRRYGLKEYRAPLLDLLVNLGYQLGHPVAQLQEELTLFRDAERGLVTVCSLKELVVQKFT
ncbi:sorting nexin-20, partial [Lampris incognitus]|uniref:sorting nexin-20 n=1 Tax=Lampris incognitus TaxID=2546036 RepID=UPI0024B544FE